MRAVNIPLLPLAVSIERRPLRRTWSLGAALIAIALAALTVAGALDWLRSRHRRWFEYHSIQAHISRVSADRLHQQAAQYRARLRSSPRDEMAKRQLDGCVHYAAPHGAKSGEHEAEASRFRQAVHRPWEGVRPAPRFAPLHPGGAKHHWWANSEARLREQYQAFLATLR